MFQAIRKENSFYLRNKYIKVNKVFRKDFKPLFEVILQYTLHMILLTKIDINTIFTVNTLNTIYLG